MDSYISHLVAVFAAVRRVMRTDSTLFVNLGDSFSNKNLNLVPQRFAVAMQRDGWIVRSILPWLKRSCMPESVDGSHYGQHQIGVKAWERLTGTPYLIPDGEDTPKRVDCPGCPKCEANGGLVLSMSAGRPTSAVEDVILFTKSGSYFWDAEAVRRAHADFRTGRNTSRPIASVADTDIDAGPVYKWNPGENHYNPAGRHYRTSDMFFDSLGPLLGAADEPEPTARKKRAATRGLQSWTAGAAAEIGSPQRDNPGGSLADEVDAGPPFPPQGLILDEDGDPLALDVNPAGYDGAHFATFPPKLVRPLILAGTSEKGCCPKCGSPWVRVVESRIEHTQAIHNGTKYGGKGQWQNAAANRHRDGHIPGRTVSETTGWLPSCRCPDPGPPVACTLLDPFAGSGTALMEADRLGRDAVGIDLQPDYVTMQTERLATDQGPLFADVEVVR